MSDPVSIAIIVSIQTVCCAAIAAWLKHGQDAIGQRQDDHHRETTAGIEVVRQDVNGKMSQLLKIQGDARQAVGNLEGHAEEKAAVAEEAKAGDTP
jgi:hypothetical protein